MYHADKYLNHVELKKLLQFWEKKFDQFFEFEVIEKTKNGREIFLVTLSDKTGAPHHEKPAYWVDGGTHAIEITSTQAALHTIDLLLKNPEFLKKYTVYVLPRISPDGVEHVLSTNILVRSSDKIYPNPDFEQGFKRSDINGDGESLYIRKKDPNGRWKVSKKDPRIMLERALTENDPDVQYYRLYIEGEFSNFDGFHELPGNNPGLDFNRNYPTGWAPKGQTPGAGDYPLSEKEPRCVVDAIGKRKNIVMLQTFHTFSGVTLRPFADKSDDEMPPHDLYVYKELGKLAKEINGYDTISVFHDFLYHPKMKANGCFLLWSYETMGILSFCTELWNIKDYVGLEKDYIKDLLHGYSEEELLKILVFMDKDHSEVDIFSDWKAYSHPQLGEVEIGGLKMLKLISNPPEKFLEELVEKQAQVIKDQLNCFPQVEISEFKTQKINDDLTKLEVVITNSGTLPTYGSQQTLNNKNISPPRVELSTIDCECIQGELAQEFAHLEGRTSSPIIQNPLFTLDINNHQKKFEWILRGSGLAQLKFTLGKAGVIRKKIQIN